jgi:hypothetical protein
MHTRARTHTALKSTSDEVVALKEDNQKLNRELVELRAAVKKNDMGDIVDEVTRAFCLLLCLSLCLSVCLSLFLSLSLSPCLFPFCLCLCLSFYLF